MRWCTSRPPASVSLTMPLMFRNYSPLIAKLRLYILLLWLSLCDFLMTCLLKSIDFKWNKAVAYKKKKKRVTKALLLLRCNGWVKKSDISSKRFLKRKWENSGNLNCPLNISPSFGSEAYQERRSHKFHADCKVNWTEKETIRSRYWKNIRNELKVRMRHAK